VVVLLGTGALLSELEEALLALVEAPSGLEEALLDLLLDVALD
jgi:hypothetical protein